MSKAKLIVAICSAIGGAIGVGKWTYDELKGRHFDEEGYNRYGLNKDGFDRNGFNKNGYDVNGYDKYGYNEAGFNENGLDEDGFYSNGYNVDGYNRNGYDVNGFNRDGFDEEGYDRNGYNAEGLDRANQDREYYTNSLNKLMHDISNHKKLSLKYRYKMLDYRFAIETLLRMIIEHYKGKSILENKDNDFLCRYIDIVYNEKLIDLTEDELKSIRIAKNYFGDFIHPKGKRVIGFKEEKAIKTVDMLFNKVHNKLDLKAA